MYVHAFVSIKIVVAQLLAMRFSHWLFIEGMSHETVAKICIFAMVSRGCLCTDIEEASIEDNTEHVQLLPPILLLASLIQTRVV